MALSKGTQIGLAAVALGAVIGLVASDPGEGVPEHVEVPPAHMSPSVAEAPSSQGAPAQLGSEEHELEPGVPV